MRGNGFLFNHTFRYRFPRGKIAVHIRLAGEAMTTPRTVYCADDAGRPWKTNLTRGYVESNAERPSKWNRILSTCRTDLRHCFTVSCVLEFLPQFLVEAQYILRDCTPLKCGGTLETQLG